MKTVFKLDEVISNNELWLKKYKFIQSHFADVKVYSPNSQYTRFSSRLVNSDYTNFEFTNQYGCLYMSSYKNLEFDNNGIIEIIKISSIPKFNRLAYISWISYKDKTKIIRFSKYLFNLKKYHFNEDIINTCRVEIVKFIKQHTDTQVDSSNLDPRLRKLISFA